MKKIVRLLVGSVLTVGCSNSTPVAPSVVPACQANNTGTVYFENRSNSATYDIVWDGAKMFTVAPRASSAPMTVSAGVAHALRFELTNLGILACAAGTPIVARCASAFYFCPG